MSKPAEKTADMSAEPAAQSRPPRTRGPRLLLTTSEHEQLSKMAKRRRRPMARYARERALAHQLPPTYTATDVQSIRSAGRRLNRLMQRINYGAKIHYGRARGFDPARIHYSEVEAEVLRLEEFLHKLPHHVGRSYWTVDRAPRRERRTYWGTVRCTPEEHASIQEKAQSAGMSEAGFIRAVVFGWPTGLGDHRDAVIQLRRFENNLRQLQSWWNGDGGMKVRIHQLRRRIRERVLELTSRKRT